MKQNAISPALPETEIKCRPRLFSLTVFYRGLKHEHVTDFSGRDRLLSLFQKISKWVFELLVVAKYLLSDETPVRDEIVTSAKRALLYLLLRLGLRNVSTRIFNKQDI